jgi:glycyl-tRNA synthetase beta chain|tara:strand:- start:4754 stop:6835 length:2082 start_codon:yes stop_codon:yes gene_type:complete
MRRDDFLVEIGTEELPPKFLRQLGCDFEDNIAAELRSLGLACEEILRYATPRRLAVIVKNLDSAQAERESVRQGPSLKAAFDDDNAPTRAALGFASSCGVEVEDLETLETDKGSRLVHRTKVPGQAVEDLLCQVVEAALARLPIDRRMRWGDQRVEFVRPLRWVVMLYGKDVVEGTILGVKADRLTTGHRFMSSGSIRLADPNDYTEALQKAKVVADFDDRRDLIRGQLEDAAAELQGHVVIDESLLDEVTALVEWPSTLAGEYDGEFLAAPREVLISAMKKHQRYFHLTDEDGALLARFLAVVNIESSNAGLVIAGNEKVIRPRLADATFFYGLDSKKTLHAKLDQLKGVVFHSELGSYFDKAQRVSNLAGFIAEQLGCDAPLAQRAGLLCKVDLVTSLVNEFPDLQGTMGYYYASNDQEAEEVAVALREQYLPAYSGDRLPASDTGRAVALADRIDTLIGLFGIGQPPSGSKDPFGLRRASLGIVRIVIEERLDLDLFACLRHSAELFTDQQFPTEQLLEYILERLSNWYQERGVPQSVVLAVRSGGQDGTVQHNFLDLARRIDAVDSFRQGHRAAALAEANKRVANILLKQVDDESRGSVDAALLTEKAEVELHRQIVAKQQAIQPMMQSRDYGATLDTLADLQAAIDSFFDEVMVMVDDLPIRNNRIALLQQLRLLFLEIADISLIQSI